MKTKRSTKKKCGRCKEELNPEYWYEMEDTWYRHHWEKPKTVRLCVKCGKALEKFLKLK